MGRKKKSSKSDTRGYSQGPTPQPSRTTPSMKQQTHHHMKELLDQFSNEPKIHQPSAPSDRFPSKLTNIVDRLDALGFTEVQIERAVMALRYEITLENALDYLCLNVDTLELPPLFTEGSLREELNTVSTAESLVVVSNVGNGEREVSVEERECEKAMNVLAAPKVKTVEQTGVVDDKQMEQKEWLLRQYEYEEDDNEDAADDHQIKDMQTSTQAQPLTLDEQNLIEKEKELQELQQDLNNDANNYMRSKQEIKMMQVQAKKLKQQVEGLKRKVERSQRQRQQEEAKIEVDAGENECGNDDSEDCGGFFDIFGQSQDVDATPIQEKQQQQRKILDYVIPTGWTGTTPQKKLDEVCRKQKLIKPKYTKLPRNEGFRLSVAISKNQASAEWEALANDFLPGSSLKDYLAMHALYAIDPTLQLYQLFPPAFRSLWMTWVNEKKDAENTAKQAEDDAKQQRIDRLVSMVAKMHSDETGHEPTTQHGVDIDETDLVTENWDDHDTTIKHAVRSNTWPTSLGKKLQQDFIERQSTEPYINMKAMRDSLPMSSFRQKILDTVKENSVTILAAETGAGKTTQCPQFILEEAFLAGHGDKTQILCTQPRRVAATSVSERVAEEMCDSLGKSVGYQIRMEAKRSAQTKLLFCTTGIVLRRLQDDANLMGVTHILVDEVHERQQQTDVLLIILRQLLNTTRPDLKVILMSATLDSDLFCSFFNGAPLISVPGRTFPVKNYYLEDVLEATNHVIEEGSIYAKFNNSYSEQTSLLVTQRGGEKRKEVVDLTSATDPIELSSLYASFSMSTRRSMERVNEEIINFDLIEDVLTLLLVGDNHPFGTDLKAGSILVFLPGLGEIKSMADRLEGSRSFNSKHFEIIPMHSTLSSRDQRRAFVPTKLRKIILSTNISETSVTIPDVVCVIDTGRVKELRQSKRFLTSQLVTDWCSRASILQRGGRAGRVQAGLCIRLYSSHTANNVMHQASIPELQRVPLEEICLSILASGFARSCRDFLSLAPQPPSEASIKSALTVLHDIGAITRDDKMNCELLTPLGSHLAKLPVNVRLGKMLLLGCIFNCIDPILTIAASLSSQSPFSTFMYDAAVAKAKQRAFSDPNSDFITYCNVWDAYRKASMASSSAGKKYCHENYLNHVSLREIGSARKQFIDLLSGIGFLDRDMILGDDNQIDEEKLRRSSYSKQSKKQDLVHAVLFAGLYPNIARLDHDTGSDYTLWHKDERLYFHQASVNASKLYLTNEQWVVFDEKFGTSKRTSISTTAFIHPMALILFGNTVVVKHIERKIIVDDWIEIKMAAQTGVFLKEIKKQLNVVLHKMINRANTKEIDNLEAKMIEILSRILAA